MVYSINYDYCFSLSYKTQWAAIDWTIYTTTASSCWHRRLSVSPVQLLLERRPRPVIPCPHTSTQQRILWMLAVYLSSGSCCVYHYAICMSILQCQVVPKDTNQICCHNTLVLRVNGYWQQNRKQPQPRLQRQRWEWSQGPSLFHLGGNEKTHFLTFRCFIRRFIAHGLIFSQFRANDLWKCVQLFCQCSECKSAHLASVTVMCVLCHYKAVNNVKHYQVGILICSADDSCSFHLW